MNLQLVLPPTPRTDPVAAAAGGRGSADRASRGEAFASALDAQVADPRPGSDASSASGDRQPDPAVTERADDAPDARALPDGETPTSRETAATVAPEAVVATPVVIALGGTPDAADVGAAGTDDGARAATATLTPAGGPPPTTAAATPVTQTPAAPTTAAPTPVTQTPAAPTTVTPSSAARDVPAPGATPAVVPGAANDGATDTDGTSAGGHGPQDDRGARPGVVGSLTAAPAASEAVERPVEKVTTPAVPAAASSAVGEGAGGGERVVVAVPAGTSSAAAAAPAAPVAAPSSALPDRPVAAQLAGPLATLRTAAPGEHVIVVRVSPDTIGPVRVLAHIGAEGVRIELLGGSDHAREALRAALPDLRRDLAGAGLQGQLSLGTGKEQAGSDAGAGLGGHRGGAQGEPSGAGRGSESVRAPRAGAIPPTGPPRSTTGLAGLDVTV
ncbi:flagellar hook-length control protein FliK [Cellulomonas fimi]|uniref:Flagellar hook-length control protein-like C-terminal domain-containing protein n=1 Tax=Cellulomonas fimi TaxID=1708 RepID=A0A7Y0QIM6_CELFI|nr:flagellar hook-length control protein FliK [Cellulomonas fimi]NMR21044.1 hypothetical protein [Cellulomonas fimi]